MVKCVLLAAGGPGVVSRGVDGVHTETGGDTEAAVEGPGAELSRELVASAVGGGGEAQVLDAAAAVLGMVLRSPGEVSVPQVGEAPTGVVVGKRKTVVAVVTGITGVREVSEDREGVPVEVGVVAQWL